MARINPSAAAALPLTAIIEMFFIKCIGDPIVRSSSADGCGPVRQLVSQLFGLEIVFIIEERSKYEEDDVRFS